MITKYYAIGGLFCTVRTIWGGSGDPSFFTAARPYVPGGFIAGGVPPLKTPPDPLCPLHQFRELMGRESPGKVLRSLIESPLAVPEEVFAALPRPCSTYSTAAPSSPCCIRHRRRKARHPPYPLHQFRELMGR